MILVTPKTKFVSFTYIDDMGRINNIGGVLEYFVNTQGDSDDTFVNLIESYSKNINIIKGYSKVITANQYELSTPFFTIKNDGNINFNTTFMSYLGSIKTVFEDSISHSLGSLLSSVGNDYTNIYVNLKLSPKIVGLVIGDRHAIHVKCGEFNYDIEPHTNEQALNSFKNAVSILQTSLIYNDHHSDKDFYVSGTGVLDSIMNYNDITTIGDSISSDLYNVLNDAKITSLKFKEYY